MNSVLCPPNVKLSPVSKRKGVTRKKCVFPKTRKGVFSFMGIRILYHLPVTTAKCTAV